MAETKLTFCRICEASCGLEVDVENDRIVGIRPNRDHVATRGYACIKGLHQHQMYDSPDRVQHPLKRTGDRWEEVSWEQALSEIGAKVRRLRERDPDSIAMYVGTAAGFGVLHPVFAQGFMQGIGSRSMYASATQDCANKFAMATQVYGFPFTQPFVDLDHTQCLILVGTNPAVSKWTFLQVPNPGKRLKEIAARGGAVFVVDPRRTESAKLAGEHVFIRPNTDVFFYLAFLRELIEIGGVDSERVGEFMSGFDELRDVAAPWTAERVAEVTRMPAETLRRMVKTYAEAEGACLASGTGVGQGTNGTLCAWLQEVINAVSGNLDRKGGSLVGSGVFDFARFGVRTGMFVKKNHSRIGDFESVNDAMPGGVLADEILTPGARQVRALFVTGGNPLLTMANASRLKRAFEELELLVTLDIYRNETGALAHYVLPATSPMQRPDLPFAFPLFLGMQARPYIAATEAMVPPTGEQRDEASIYVDLARACGAPLFGSALAQKALELAMAWHSRKEPQRPPSLPQKALLSLLLRVTGQGSFDALVQEPHGRLRDAGRGDDYLGKRVVTDDGLVHLAPSRFVEAARGLEATFEEQRRASDRLRLISKRDHKTHNSWTHNISHFVDNDFDTNHLHMNREDADRLGLRDGDLADVSTAVATVRVPVRLIDDLMPGAVALPHGWGHQHADGLSVASRTKGVNVNILAADGPDRIERLSGMAHLTGIEVEVRPAAGPQDVSSWSGLSDEDAKPNALAT